MPISDVMSMVRFCFLQVVETTYFLWVLETKMFLIPMLITMTIAATRMYRSLTNYGSPHCTQVCVIFPSIILRAHPGRCHKSSKGSDNIQISGRPALHMINARRVEVATNTTFDLEQRLTSPRDNTVSFVSMEGQLNKESRELSLREDADHIV